MFSLFGKKKVVDAVPTEEAAQIAADAQKCNNGGDDFIFVEPNRQSTASVGGIYPPVPLAPYGALPYPPPLGHRTGPGPGAAPINYLQDIPFELSPQLATKERYNGTQMQVDSIIASMSRQLSVDDCAEEYTFVLERAVQNECY